MGIPSVNTSTLKGFHQSYRRLKFVANSLQVGRAGPSAPCTRILSSNYPANFYWQDLSPNLASEFISEPGHTGIMDTTSMCQRGRDVAPPTSLLPVGRDACLAEASERRQVSIAPIAPFSQLSTMRSQLRPCFTASLPDLYRFPVGGSPRRHQVRTEGRADVPYRFRFLNEPRRARTTKPTCFRPVPDPNSGRGGESCLWTTISF
jgi:hypothetical protein